MVDVIYKIALTLAGIATAVHYSIQSYLALQNIKKEAQASKKQIFSTLVSYIVSVFCIASLTTLFTQYLYPDYGIFAPDSYVPIFRKTPFWLNFSIIVTVSVLGLYFANKIFKRFK